jgi:hypothetical protein
MEEPTSSAETRWLEAPPSWVAEMRRLEEPSSWAEETRQIEDRESRIDTVPGQPAIASLLGSDDPDDRAPTLRVEHPGGQKMQAQEAGGQKMQAQEASGTLPVRGRTFAVDPRHEAPTPVGSRFAELQARARNDLEGADRPESPLVPLVPLVPVERVRAIQAELQAMNGRKKPVNLERLAKMLEETAARLKAQYGDRTISFEVVMKDGKAVIKPIVR